VIPVGIATAKKNYIVTAPLIVRVFLSWNTRFRSE